MLGYNDSEQMESSMYEFTCWDRPLLRAVAPFTMESHLDSLPNDPHEVDFDLDGAGERESGWLRIDGHDASSQQETISDPAVYAVLIEIFGTCSASDLPWEECTQTNGDLLPQSLFGDGPIPVNGDNQ